MAHTKAICNFFLKKKEVVKEKTLQEIEADRLRKCYRLEFMETLNQYFVQYHFKDRWWYLRQWDDDYTLESARGNAIKLQTPEFLDTIIARHQEWMKGGRIFMPLEY